MQKLFNGGNDTITPIDRVPDHVTYSQCVPQAAVTAEACQPLMVNVKTSIKKYAAQVERSAPVRLFAFMF